MASGRRAQGRLDADVALSARCDVIAVPMSHPVGERKPEFQLSAWFLTAVVMALSGTLIVRLVWLLDRGFDFTDQSLYLMLAQRPAEYELTYGLFGYGLHPLYELVGGSIASMERVGALVLVVLGAALGLVVS